MGTIIEGAEGLFTGRREAPRAKGAIRYEAGIITHVGDVVAAPGDTIIDASGCVIYPGLVNTHHHLAQSMLKAIPAAIDLPVTEWLVEVPYRYWRKLDEATFRLAATIGMVELLLSGATTIADHHYIYSPDLGYDPSEILFEIAASLGLRFVLCRGSATRPSRLSAQGAVGVPAETIAQTLDTIAALAQRFHQSGPGSMRKVVLAPTNLIWSVEPQDIRDLSREGRALGLRLHSHLSEAPGDVAHCLQTRGLRPVHYAAQNDFVGDDVWFAHLVHVDDAELNLLVETGTGMAHCPQSNARLGSGIAPAPKLAALGGRVTIGVDGAASNEAADMISEMHSAWHLHRTGGRPDAVRVEDVVSWSSVNGARMLGFEDTGSLEPSMAADIAVFDLSQPRYAGLHDPLIGPVVSAGSAQMRRLVIAGADIVVDGIIPGLDLGNLARDARRGIARLIDQN
ncbi:amidohydrolase family protein [Devosia chinhatensis]|uniref:Amidohydrolase n=1 Tax=Devosia chinhatensis TaxID=429727 RepID=A0A0F5FML3_9HYPH|nr:amidohydrolase family protein [Devosia chinhatensis]KKB10076.1 amidohydrolase [Devosia chinhatensis]